MYSALIATGQPLNETATGAATVIQLEGSPLEPGTVSQLLLSKQTSVCFVASLCQLFFFKFHQLSPLHCNDLFSLFIPKQPACTKRFKKRLVLYIF